MHLINRVINKYMRFMSLAITSSRQKIYCENCEEFLSDDNNGASRSSKSSLDQSDHFLVRASHYHLVCIHPVTHW